MKMKIQKLKWKIKKISKLKKIEVEVVIIIIIIYCLQDIKLTCANFHNIPIYVTQLMVPCIGIMNPARLYVCQESLLGAHHLGNIVSTNV